MTVFSTPAPIAATIDVPVGTVTVTAADRADTVVEIRPADPSNKTDVRAAEQFRVEFTGTELTVRLPRGRWNPFGGTPSVEVEVLVPTGSRLTATLAVGGLHTAGAFDGCALTVADGDIRIERPRGAVTAVVARGDIRVEDAASGVLRLETSTGELAVGIRPGSAARLATHESFGPVRNQLEPAEPGAELVEVHARNSYGPIVVGHAVAV
ncbi:DUF4097 domain-containing protein [Nocardia asteroides]|uniref:DUF4097 domain-containing protein n=1 Tax=Nocardia asteroides TaxID=1824 RepID=UPI001E547FC7|nr:DUF4097 domain-containing protein [Nocardia asteroides]UGT62217.1 DUF4097 domain-containing protein [Nocardia asteroides]